MWPFKNIKPEESKPSNVSAKPTVRMKMTVDGEFSLVYSGGMIPFLELPVEQTRQLFNYLKLHEHTFNKQAKPMSLPPVERFFGDHRPLSNFWLVDVVMGGWWYKSVEHAFQAAKTNDLDERKKIQQAETCGEAKKLGRIVTLREDWERVKIDVMEGLLKQKFNDPFCQMVLICTEGRELIEGNTWGDTFWGVCEGKGENNLGKLLMKIRAELLKPIE